MKRQIKELILKHYDITGYTINDKEITRYNINNILIDYFSNNNYTTYDYDNNIELLVTSATFKVKLRILDNIDTDYRWNKLLEYEILKEE